MVLHDYKQISMFTYHLVNGLQVMIYIYTSEIVAFAIRIQMYIQ